MTDISDNIQCLTLEYLMNPLQYEKYVNTHAHAATEHNREKDRRFYRRRIVQMTKELSKGNFPREALHGAYQSYAAQLVEYFKATDTQDILQTRYEGMSVEGPSSTKLMGQAEQERSDATILSVARNSTNGAAAMEQFVIRDDTHAAPVPSPPTLRKVTLDNPSLRNKGVRSASKHKEKKKI